MLVLQIILVAIFPALLICAALRDATSFTIPNWISLAAAAMFVPVALFLGLPLPVVGLALSLGVAALLLGMLMFAFGWIGGGDAKLMAACGVWIGWSAFLPFLIFTGAAGGALAVLLLMVRKMSFWLPPRLPAWMKRLATPGENVPYGVAIAIGALAVFPTTPVAAAMGHVLRG
ncbi:MAG: prepilin peptidase [Caulobacteraceae bacterium]|nr:prepilin peptidase [Caulobacter sp.]